MSMKHALQAALAISLAGVVFSGFLTWREFAARTVTCTPVAQPGTIFGYPPCVYGLAMYLLLTIVAVIGLRSR